MNAPPLPPLAAVDRAWRPNNATPLELRLWRRVGISGSGCWEWVGATVGGYGRIRAGGASRSVHRVAYELLIGPVPDGLQLDHLCRNRACCNPEHLEPVTPRTNTLRGESLQAQNARKTHCANGHPLSGENLILRFNPTHKNGHRVCGECERLRSKRQIGEPPDMANARKTHCRHGHEFTDANTYYYDGSRNCRACIRRRVAEYKARKVATP